MSPFHQIWISAKETTYGGPQESFGMGSGHQKTNHMNRRLSLLTLFPHLQGVRRGCGWNSITIGQWIINHAYRLKPWLKTSKQHDLWNFWIGEHIHVPGEYVQLHRDKSSSTKDVSACHVPINIHSVSPSFRPWHLLTYFLTLVLSILNILYKWII